MPENNVAATTISVSWDHVHNFTTTIITRDHYYDYEVKYCLVCDQLATASGIPTNKHFRHPKGCKCYWCVWCLCSELNARERG